MGYRVCAMIDLDQSNILIVLYDMRCRAVLEAGGLFC